MIVRLLLALLVLGYLFWLHNRYRSLPDHKKRGWLFKTTIYSLAGIMLVAVLAGKMHWVGALLAGVIAAGKYGLRFLPFLKFFNVHKAFGNPVFKTRYLTIQLNIQAGSISGQITDGPHAETTLDQVTPEILQELEDYYRERDGRSYYLIRVLRARAGTQYSSTGNNGSQQYNDVGDPAYDEALQILGLESLAKQQKLTKSDVVKAHRHLIQKLHPDRGGNDYLAARVNQAKDVVLTKL